tara:strand:+ start:79 stop:1563 length:1485 start_codon:yes stop_codon:yes gene_type:complete
MNRLSVILIVGTLLAPVSLLAAPPQELPVIGDTTSGLISLDMERELGQAFLRSLRSQAPTVSDALLKDYLEFLIYRLAYHSQLQDRRLDLVVIDSPQLNAFAAPGGIIGINLGLFIHAETENEFSAILAHELAHLSQRHFARQVDSSRRSTLTVLAGLLASIILISTTGGDAGLAAITASQALAQQSALRHSRGREAEADRVGMLTLVEADKDPRAMAYMFEQLAKLNRYAGERMPEFLMTHPVTQSRIADSYNQSNQYPVKKFDQSLDYQLMKARVLVLQEKYPQNSVKQMQQVSTLERHFQKIARQYGLLLALTRVNRTEEAVELLRPLLDEFPGKIAFILAQTDIDLAAQRYQQAIAMLEKHLKINPDNFPLTMQYAEALLKVDKPDQAEYVLEKLTATRPTDPDVWYLLAETYGLADNIPGVHQARAEFFLLTGRLDQAAKQLSFALPLVVDNFQITARINERLLDISKLQHNSRKQAGKNQQRELAISR